MSDSNFSPNLGCVAASDLHESDTHRNLRQIIAALKLDIIADEVYVAVERLLYEYQLLVLQGVRENMGKHTGVSWYLVEKCGSEDKRALISYQDGPRAEWANECFADEVPLWLLHGLLRRIQRRKPFGDQDADDTIQRVDKLDAEYVQKISNQPHYASYVGDADD